MERLDGKRALVTGGSRGIGRAIADRLAADGARVVTCGRGPRPADLASAMSWITADVADPTAAERLVRDAHTALGGLDILVNNAGIQVEETVEASTEEDWDRVIGTNAKGLFQCCRAAIPLMRSGGGGVIINIGSTSGFASDPDMALYNASKAFVHSLTRSIAIDHGRDGIRCNAVCPGWTDTGMADAAFALARNPAVARADALNRHAVRRFGMPQDVAAMVAYLAGADAAFTSGQTFIVDGGLLAASPIQPSLS
jgi:meso-butanediol dehydrogenase/(S,S)-butanediol dehydrogenase/diacetyl reductase